ncbi:hypothetical protein Tco_0490677 [Tanacetum coccineum]
MTRWIISDPNTLKGHETVGEVLLPQVHHEFLLWEGCNRDAKSRYNTRLTQLLPRHIYSPCIVNWDVPNRMGCDGEIGDMLRIRLREAESDEGIFTSFDEVCADDDLQTKKIIKFRLGGRAHSLTLLEFARRLGLYQAVELEEDGFNVYFEGVNGDSVSPIASASAGAEGPISPKTAEQKLERKNKLNAKSTLMLAISDEHLLKFHACKDAKSL